MASTLIPTRTQDLSPYTSGPLRLREYNLLSCLNRNTTSNGASVSSSGNYNTSALYTSLTTRHKVGTIDPANTITARWSNILRGGETGNGGFAGPTQTVAAIILTASYEDPSGVIRQFTFGGQTSYLLKPWEAVIADPLPIAIAANSTSYIRTCYTSSTGANIFFPSTGSITQQTLIGDNTSPTIPASAFSSGTVSTYSLGPDALLGRVVSIPVTPVTSAAYCLGDSVMYGVGSSDAIGWLRRGLGYVDDATLNRPVYMDAMSGQRLSWVAHPGSHRYLDEQFQLGDIGVVAMGINDFTNNNSASFNPIPTADQAYLNYCKSAALRVFRRMWRGGIPPVSVLQFPWATTSHHANWGPARHIYNQWQRSLVGTELLAVIDCNVACEATPETGGTNESQQIKVASATGGTFTATFGGQTALSIPYNVTASALAAALGTLSSVGIYNIVGIIDPSDATANLLTFIGALGSDGQPLITVSGVGLTGVNATVTVTRRTAGVVPFEGSNTFIDGTADVHPSQAMHIAIGTSFQTQFNALMTLIGTTF